MRVNRGAKLKRPRKKIYTEKITMAIDSKTLEEFKKIVGKGYQSKIREIMQMYIDAYYRKLNEKR